MNTSVVYNDGASADQSVPEGWLTVARAAEALGLTARAVRMQCKRGKLKALCASGRWHIDPACSPQLRLAAGDYSPSPAIAGKPLSGLSDAKRDRIAKRYEVTRAYLDARDCKPADMPLPQFERNWIAGWNAAHPDNRTSRRTLLRHMKKLREGGVAALVDRRDYHGPASISPEALDMILGLYLVQQRPHLPAVYERAKAIAATEGWLLPSLRTVQRIVRERVDSRMIDLGRDPRAYRDRHVPTAERDWSQVHANQCWVADHRILDIWVPRRWYDKKAKADRITWQRPWLTMFLDALSWYPVAWRIAFDDPNCQRVMECFIDGVLAHGTPGTAILDNGKDFRAGRFGGGRQAGGRRPKAGATAEPTASGLQPPARRRTEILRTARVTPLLELLGVDVRWALPYNARAKVIEPFFGIVAERFDKNWETYCGNSPQNTPEQIKGLKAEDFIDKINLTVIQTAFDAWVTDDYAHRESPAKACRGYSAIGAFETIRPADYQARRPAAEDLAMLLLPSRAVTVRPNGIAVSAFGGISYDSRDPAFTDRRGTRRKVTYRYNAADPSFIYVFDAESDRFLCIATPYAGAGIDPLAAHDSPDADRLADVMTARNSQSKKHKAELTRVQTFAGNVLLASQAQAAEETGLHIPSPARQLPVANCQLPAVIPLIAGGELSKAAAEAKAHQARTDRTRAAQVSAAELLATGTTDLIEKLPPAPQPTALDLLLNAQSKETTDDERPKPKTPA